MTHLHKTAFVLMAALTLVLAGCTGNPSRYDSYGHDRGYNNYDRGYDQRDPRGQRCYDCGTVERIQRVAGTGGTTGAGAVLGGVVGGVIGNQVGEGNGRRAARIGGAVAGAAIGNAIEAEQNRESYDIYVRMDDGRSLIVGKRNLGDIREGDYVEVRGDGIRVISRGRY